MPDLLCHSEETASVEAANDGRTITRASLDTVAHPDPLGFEHPRIKVQVKHRKDSIGSPETRSFLRVLRGDDSGLYVSTSSFTSDALLKAEWSSEPVTLLDRGDFIRLLLEHYGELMPEHKSKIPLRKE